MAKKIQDQYIWGTGRRKTAVARVRIKDGSGKFLVNNRELAEYFRTETECSRACEPLKTVQLHEAIDVHVTARGGGCAAQAGAIALGIARALVLRNPEHEQVLRDAKYLTRDSRQKERKKYGRAAARRSFQFSKR
ncbi:MAG: 30S ribosomal protein S9 [Planctomycetes bacterium]|nr:30S ribosomal protein S9 [Planctomycetota bacterium]